MNCRVYSGSPLPNESFIPYANVARWRPIPHLAPGSCCIPLHPSTTLVNDTVIPRPTNYDDPIAALRATNMAIS